MSPQPFHVPPPQPLLRDFERLHAQWLEASTAADALEGCACADAQAVQRLLRQRLEADRLHQEAMRLLRDAPL